MITVWKCICYEKRVAKFYETESVSPCVASTKHLIHDVNYFTFHVRVLFLKYDADQFVYEYYSLKLFPAQSFRSSVLPELSPFISSLFINYFMYGWYL